MPSVFAFAPLLGSVCTTTPWATKSILSAPTRTSRAFVDFPLACGFFTASHGVFGDTVLVESPSRRFDQPRPVLRATQISHRRSGENPPHRAPRRLCTLRPRISRPPEDSRRRVRSAAGNIRRARQTCAHRLGDSGHAVERLRPTRRLGRSVRLEAPRPGALLASALPNPCRVALASGLARNCAVLGPQRLHVASSLPGWAFARYGPRNARNRVSLLPITTSVNLCGSDRHNRIGRLRSQDPVLRSQALVLQQQLLIYPFR